MTKSYRSMEWTPERIARFWDWQSQFPECYFTYQFGDRIVQALREHLTGKHSVLDFGCGTGFLIPSLAAVAENVYGGDVSPKSLERTNKYAVGVANFRGAYLISDLVARKLRFDAIMIVEVVEHLPDHALVEVLNTARELVKPNGRVIITTPNEERLEDSEIYCAEADVVFHRWQHVRSWTASRLSDWVTKHGYEVVKVYTTDFSLWPTASLRGLRQRFQRARNPQSKPPHLVCVARPKCE